MLTNSDATQSRSFAYTISPHSVDRPPIIEIVQFSDIYLVNRTEDCQNYNVEIQAKTLKT